MIDSDRKLAEHLPDLRTAPWMALDTEADSLHAYPEKLCLIQLALPGRELLVDPLSSCRLEPLWKVLKKHDLIMHGADYDLRLLHKAGCFVPNVIFDTMLAARLLGCRQFGLMDLLFHSLGVQLEKGPQKANWAKRPLTSRMETYALNDVRYLKPLAESLREKLKLKGRLSWHSEACRRLIADCSMPRPVDPDQLWRVRGSHQLGPNALGVLKEIWRWREEEALRTNKPPYFILTPESMVAVAVAAVNGRSMQAHLPRRFSPHRHATLQEAVQRGLANPLPPLLPKRIGRRLTESEKGRFRQLEQRRDRQAKELGIDPTVIASRALLLALARDWQRTCTELMSWQLALLETGMS